MLNAFAYQLCQKLCRHNRLKPSPLDSEYNIQSARSRKLNKPEYHQLLAEFDCLNIQNYYETTEISVLGYYLPSSIQNIKTLHNFLSLKSLSSDRSSMMLLISVWTVHRSFFWSGTVVNGQLSTLVNFICCFAFYLLLLYS